VLQVVPARRSIRCRGSYHLRARFDIQSRICRPEIRADRDTLGHAQNALPWRIDIADAPIAADDDDGIAERIHGGTRSEVDGVRRERGGQLRAVSVFGTRHSYKNTHP
jgi:hypothetical protein